MCNIIAISKLPLTVAQKKDNLCVKRVSVLYIGDAQWGHYAAPNNASWDENMCAQFRMKMIVKV